MKNNTMKIKMAALLRAFTGSLALTVADALANPGDLDTSFGTGGKVTTAIGNSEDESYAVAVQSDGKILVAGQSWNGSNQDFALVRYKSDGTLDTSFNGTGKVTTEFGSGYDVGRSVVLQGDGKILVAGSIGGSNQDFALARYNTDGTLDMSFNGTGKVNTDFGGTSDGSSSVALQADGKIVVAGFTYFDGHYDFAVARYKSDGTLDTSFNGSGKATTAVGSSEDYGYSVAVQSDGKILVAGQSWNGSNQDFALVRYKSDGTLDTSFNGSGKVTTDLGSGYDSAYSVVVQGDGKILVAGSNGDFALVRYNTDGTLDTSFNGTGKVTTDFSFLSYDEADSVALQADGKIVVAGYSHNYSINVYEFALARYNSNGTLDTSFNGSGKVTTVIGNSFDFGQSIAVQGDGKILVAGYSYNGSNNDIALVRYNVALPDARLGLDTSVLKGDDIYNLTGEGQTQKVNIQSGGETRKVFIGIQNDGPASDSFAVKGKRGNADFGVKYFDGTTDVTSAVKAGTFSTGTLAPGEMFLLKAKIKAKTSVPGKIRNFRIQSTSEGNPTESDVATIKAKSI